MTCDSAGYPTSDGSTRVLVYTGTADYKIICTTSADVTVWSHDNVRGASTIPTATTSALPTTPVASKTAAYTVVTGDRGKLFNCNSTGGAFGMTLPSAVTAGDNFRVGFRHDGTAGTVALLAIGGQTIGYSGKTSTAKSLTGYGETMWLVSDGANWKVDTYVPPLITGGIGVIRITDRLTAPPASPTAGARYIVNGTATGVWATLSFALHDIAEADGNGSWIRITPSEGMFAYVLDENLYTAFVDAAWSDQTGMSAAGSSNLEAAEFSYSTADTITASTWKTIPHATTNFNGITGASLSAGSIILPTGKYLIAATITPTVPQNTTAMIRSRLYSSTNSAVKIISNNGRMVTVASNNGNVTSVVVGYLSVTAATETFVHQWWSSDNSVVLGTTDGAGSDKYASITILDLSALQGATGAQGPQGPAKRAAITGGPIPRTMWIEMDGLCQPGIVTLETAGAQASFTAAYVTEKIHACYHDLGIRRFIIATITDNGRTYTTWTSTPVDPSGAAFVDWWDDVDPSVQPYTDDFDVLDHIMDVTSALEGCEVIIGLGRHDDIDLLNDCYDVTFLAGVDPLTFGKTVATRLSEEITRYTNESAAIYARFGSFPSFGGFYITHETDHIQSSDDLYTPVADILDNYGQVHVSAATPIDLADSNTIADAINAWHVDWVWPQTSTGYGYNWSTGVNAYVSGISIFGGAAHYATWRLVLNRARFRTAGAYTPKFGGHIENWRIGVQGTGTLTFGATSGSGVTVTLGTSDAITSAGIGKDIVVRADQATGIARITAVTGSPVTSVTVNITENLADVNIASGFWALVPNLTDATVDAYPALHSEVLFELRDQVAAGVEDVSLYAMQYWDPGNLSLRHRQSQAGITTYRDKATTGWITHANAICLMQQAAMRVAAMPGGLQFYTVATLPSARPAGQTAYVTDANATTFMSTVAAGGANIVPVFADGTNWKIG